MGKSELRNKLVELATEYVAGFVILNLNVSHESRKRQLEAKIDKLLAVQAL